MSASRSRTIDPANPPEAAFLGISGTVSRIHLKKNKIAFRNPLPELWPVFGHKIWRNIFSIISTLSGFYGLQCR
ncbi:hypothetical protein SBA4_460005 [Candidatus Sulfopaludibacter sp. SbA4]|nr:hypothetical protein SBA4_460005 [Candidatus Sulfopaludibacter sp. SbA4]